MQMPLFPLPLSSTASRWTQQVTRFRALVTTGSAPWQTRVGTFQVPGCVGSILFQDGFESDDTSAWSSAVPQAGTTQRDSAGATRTEVAQKAPGN